MRPGAACYLWLWPTPIFLRMLLCPVVACKCVVVVDVVVVVAVVVVVQCKSIASQYLRRPTTRSHSIALAAASTSFGPRFDFGWLWVFVWVLFALAFGWPFYLQYLWDITQRSLCNCIRNPKKKMEKQKQIKEPHLCCVWISTVSGVCSASAASSSQLQAASRQPPAPTTSPSEVVYEVCIFVGLKLKLSTYDRVPFGASLSIWGVVFFSIFFASFFGESWNSLAKCWSRFRWLVQSAMH